MFYRHHPSYKANPTKGQPSYQAKFQMHRESKIQYPPFYKANPTKGQPSYQTRFLMQEDSKILPNCFSHKATFSLQKSWFIRRNNYIGKLYPPRGNLYYKTTLSLQMGGLTRGRLRFRRCMQAANISLFVFLSLLDICTWQLFLYIEESWNNSSPYFLLLYM